MEDLYHENNIVIGAAASSTVEGFHHHQQHLDHHQDSSSSYRTNNKVDNNDGFEELDGAKVEQAAAESADIHSMSDLMIKSQISTHPLYPQLVSAYISCQKVGATPEITNHLEEIGRSDNQRLVSNCTETTGTDPQLDEFMKSYCEVLHRYKEEISRPFDEASIFIRDIELQLSKLCRDSPTKTTMLGSHSADDAAAASEEELSCGELEPPETTLLADGREIKEVLRIKYGGCLTGLRNKFLKKKKNGKLPKDARAALLQWWNNHHKWPYPTDEEKMKLIESTGLDSKQINNWFINQRKRHWKPSEDKKLALMEDLSGHPPPYFKPGDGSGQIAP